MKLSASSSVTIITAFSVTGVIYATSFSKANSDISLLTPADHVSTIAASENQSNPAKADDASTITALDDVSTITDFNLPLDLPVVTQELTSLSLTPQDTVVPSRSSTFEVFAPRTRVEIDYGADGTIEERLPVLINNHTRGISMAPSRTYVEIDYGADGTIEERVSVSIEDGHYNDLSML